MQTATAPRNLLLQGGFLKGEEDIKVWYKKQEMKVLEKEYDEYIQGEEGLHNLGDAISA